MCPTAGRSYLTRTVAITPHTERSNPRLLFLALPVFFFFLTRLLAFYFGMSEHESTLHDCSEYVTVRFFFQTKTLSRNANEFEIRSSTLSLFHLGHKRENSGNARTSGD